MKILLLISLIFTPFCKTGHEKIIQKYLDDYPNHMIGIKSHQCLNDTLMVAKIKVKNLDTKSTFCDRVIVSPNSFKSYEIDCELK